MLRYTNRISVLFPSQRTRTLHVGWLRLSLLTGGELSRFTAGRTASRHVYVAVPGVILTASWWGKP